MLSKTTLEAAKLVDEAMERFKATLEKNGKTVDDWLAEQKIYIEETRRRVAEREKREQEESQAKKEKNTE